MPSHGTTACGQNWKSFRVTNFSGTAKPTSLIGRKWVPGEDAILRAVVTLYLNAGGWSGSSRPGLEKEAEWGVEVA